ncbi:MAG: hypothetical protein ACD_5C00006G0005 [uncultured bacterium]|nr:MAG: hypothetical protein ACD_5C00006G0005 [uncultured bacterium]
MSKTVRAVISIVILIVIGAGVTYALKFKSKPIEQQQVTLPKEIKKEEIKKVEQESKKFETIILDGIVSKVTNQDIEIQNGEIKNTLLFNQNISVILVSNGAVEKKDTSYLKSGQKISITINQSDSSIISIQILEGDNVSKVF